MIDSSLNLLPTSTHLRPYRIALLIPASAKKDWISDELITWMCSIWGGESFFVFPVYSREKNDKSFLNWLGLLQKYDPDIILSLGKFKETTMKKIFDETHLQTQSFNSLPFGASKSIRRGHRFIANLENVLSECKEDKKYHITDYESTGSKIHDLWFYSLYGKLGRYKKEFKEKHNINVETKKHTVKDDVFRLNNNFMEDVLYPPERSPMLHSREYLSSITVDGYYSAYTEPNIIIIGNTVADWALFQSLKTMSAFVHWIPTYLIKKDNEVDRWGGLNSFLFNQLSDPSHQRFIISSASLSQEKIINNCKSAFRYSDNKNCFSDVEYEFDFKKILKSRLFNVETGNTYKEKLIVSGDNRLDRISSISPKSFNVTKTNLSFVNVLLIENHAMLTHEYSNIIQASWVDGEYTSKDELRMNSFGGITFNPPRIHD